MAELATITGEFGKKSFQKNMAVHPHISVCHITPHLGGGVGSVVMCWMRHAPEWQRHHIFCLDNNKNTDWQELPRACPNVHIEDGVWHRAGIHEMFRQHIAQADVVVVHLWNHPLLFDVLLNYEWPPCRLVAWNHVSGLHAPYVVSEEMVQFADIFVSTSPITPENVDIPSFANKIPDKCCIIWSTVGVDDFKELQRAPHEDFLVGYTGTVDIGKLHSEYVSMSAAAHKPGMRFIVCSGDSQQSLQLQAQQAGVDAIFDFTGRVPSVLPYLAQYDVFGYPLQRQHFGTCEQSLGEAMMAGCVPVVLNNPTEQYIVEHEKSGLVAKNAHEYSEALQRIYHDRELLQTLALGARKRALQLYGLQSAMDAWDEILEKLLRQPRCTRSYYPKSQPHYTPAQLYIAALGQHAVPLTATLQGRQTKERLRALEEVEALFQTNPMFVSANKGSVFQYLQFFPHDPILQEWGSIARKERP